MVERTGAWSIVGIIERSGSSLTSVSNYPVIGTDDDLVAHYKPGRSALVTVGQIKSSALRRRLFAMAEDAGFELPVIVSPLASVARTALIGAGSVLMHFSHIGPDAVTGRNVIINTRATIEHDVMVGSHCHIATGVLVNGAVLVGDDTFIGSGAVCREGISIGSRCVISMGMNVKGDIADDSIAR